MPDWAAILFSTVIVLIVAEVVPMSYSTGSYKYIIAYYGAPLVSLMIKVFWPVCYPIARGLDMLLRKYAKQANPLQQVHIELQGVVALSLHHFIQILP